MKPKTTCYVIRDDKVAPRRGAWVETFGRCVRYEKGWQVAPRRGAWVETMASSAIDPAPGCRTPQGCVG